MDRGARAGDGRAKRTKGAADVRRKTMSVLHRTKYHRKKKEVWRKVLPKASCRMIGSHVMSFNISVGENECA